MRDRMIIFRDQFDLDDCFRLLLGGSVFHGGDPAVAGSWELCPEFFEKYWFLTIDYNLRRYTNEWRKRQGLQELKSNVHFNPNDKYYHTVSSTPLSESPPWLQQNEKPVHNNINLSDYPRVTPIAPKTKPQQPQQQQRHPDFVPVHLTNGYRAVQPNIKHSNSTTTTSTQPMSPLQQQATESFLGSKNYSK
jgi:hypothetical protein